MASGGDGSVLRFTCNECGTHLSVGGSLAGAEAPCPKCGTVIVAPGAKSRKEWVPSSGVERGISGGGGFQAAPRERGASGGGGFKVTPREREAVEASGGAGARSASSGRVKSRKVVPNEWSMSGEVGVVIKILIATGLVVLIVALVTWFLKNQ